MKKFTKPLLAMSLLLGALGTVAAQETAAVMPPKVLSIIREFVKPGKAGMSHEKTESAFVKSMREAKWPTHYLAVDALSGKPRTLFLTAFDSFAAVEKDAQATEKNAAFSAALDHAGVVDGELLSDTDSGTFMLREDYSLRPATDIPHMRYFQISIFHSRPGHEKEFDTLVKMYIAGYEKISDVHWVTYQSVFGQEDGTFLVFTPMKSLSEVDRSFGQDKQFGAAMGEEGMKKIGELSAASIESSQTNLFAFNPRISYPSDDWVKADPDFWNPKPAHASAASSKKSKDAAKAK